MPILAQRSEILFRISRPYKQSKTMRAKKVVLPAINGKITILPERAPIMVALDNGIIEILNDKNEIVERWFIKGGIADIAKNRCAVSSEKVIAYNYYNKETATKKRDEAHYPEDAKFYQFIIDNIAN